MSLTSHLQELKRKHQTLSEEVEQAQRAPGSGSHGPGGLPALYRQPGSPVPDLPSVVRDDVGVAGIIGKLSQAP